jgi:hypothetical protein
MFIIKNKYVFLDFKRMNSNKTGENISWFESFICENFTKIKII